ncbi:gluconate 2-dehydrogenase subunit 3 family protein [Pseudolabrys taiwanensis]|uniref:Gluconate 2-dehydrogenase subunit 3 family protein n=1 Tax=Pseudolabrys taiwanensis TaxID=331696 RepID=A0A345ZW56_9HYPH|nr:gluconate 2-dehydrogenase subunit 3 family protein [Pseudolabrys taiwanensis]AXK81153.1 gluconate 2-dehydrogenase subunit 3 family protein [Pseudolabrys taiwanensis]
MTIHRRQLLASAACIVLTAVASKAVVAQHALPWHPNAGAPPTPVRPGPWLHFTADEAKAVEAIADRIIPPDPQTPGGKDAGCAVYLDRQLAGPYGRAEGDYNKGPFRDGLKGQGPQTANGPAKQYRAWLAALDKHCVEQQGGKHFADLSDTEKDALLGGLESGEVKLTGVDGKEFFEHIVKDVQTGFFADPIYGGNRDMVAWKMIGFPGTRYNYLDWIDRHNERFPLPPVSLEGRAAWTPKAG